MEKSAWYKHRRKIADQQEVLKPVVEDLEKHLQEELKRYPMDPVTKKDAVRIGRVEHGFSIVSVTGTTEQVTLQPAAMAIDIVPPISVGERTVAKIYGVQTDGRNVSFTVERPADGDVGVQLPYLLTALIEAVLT